MSELINMGQPPPSAPKPKQDAEQEFPDPWRTLSAMDRWRRFFYGTCLKYKWLILAITIAGMVLAAFQTYTMTPLYRAAVTIQMDPGFSNVLPYKEVAAADMASTNEYMATQTAVLESRILAERVVERLNLMQEPAFYAPRSDGILIEAFIKVRSGIQAAMGLLMPGSQNSQNLRTAKSGPSKPALISRYLSDLDVKPRTDGRILDVSYTSHDPKIAARLVEATVEEFINLNFESKYRTTKAASEFLGSQLLDQKAKVEKAEEALVSYARAHGILELDKDHGEQIVMQRLTALNGQLSAVQAKLNAAKADYETASAATPKNFPSFLVNGSISDLEQRISALRQNLATLSTRFGPRWPEILQVQEQIGALERQLTQEKQRAIADARSSYRTTLQEYRHAVENLESQKNLAESQNESLMQYKMLMRDVDSNRQIYDELLQRSKEAGISATLKPDTVRIIDSQGIPKEPYMPNELLALGFGLFGGLFAGVALASVLASLDNTVNTPDEIEQILGLPMLGIIPRIRVPKLVKPPQASATQGTASIEPRDPAVIPWRKLTLKSWDPYRALRTAILLSNSDHPPRSILVTSALLEEGKTTTAVNLGIALAHTGARTLIMGVDMRKPKLSRIFGLNGGPGVSAYLSESAKLEPAIVRTAVPNLCLAPAGAIPPNPAELIGSRRMKELLVLLRNNFDYVVIDTPPVIPCTDAVVLSPLVDGVVLVARDSQTPRKALDSAATLLLNVGAKILGVVLNDIDLTKPEYAYRYGFKHRYYQSESQK